MAGYNTSKQYKTQTVRLNRVGKVDMGWKKCPNCEERCVGRELYQPGAGYWCYNCGWRTGMPLAVKEAGAGAVKSRGKSRPEPIEPVGFRRVVIRSY